MADKLSSESPLSSSTLLSHFSHHHLPLTATIVSDCYLNHLRDVNLALSSPSVALTAPPLTLLGSANPSVVFTNRPPPRSPINLLNAKSKLGSSSPLTTSPPLLLPISRSCSLSKAMETPLPILVSFTLSYPPCVLLFRSRSRRSSRRRYWRRIRLTVSV